MTKHERDCLTLIEATLDADNVTCPTFANKAFYTKGVFIAEGARDKADYIVKTALQDGTITGSHFLQRDIAKAQAKYSAKDYEGCAQALAKLAADAIRTMQVLEAEYTMHKANLARAKAEQELTPEYVHSVYCDRQCRMSCDSKGNMMWYEGNGKDRHLVTNLCPLLAAKIAELKAKRAAATQV